MKKIFFLPLILLALLFVGGCSSDDDGPSGPTIDPPSDLSATALSDNSIRLNWTDNSPFELGFRIQRAPIGTTTWQQIAELGENAKAYTDTGLTEGTGFQYQVMAFARTISSTFSNTATATTKLKKPTSLTATRVDGQTIQLGWVDLSEIEESYEIQRRRSGVEYETVATLTSNVTNYTDTGLESGVRFTYKVRAVLGENASEWSDSARATTTIYFPPAPTNLTGQAMNSTEVLLNWDDNSFNELGFVMEYSPANQSQWLGDSILFANRRSHTIGNLSASTEYDFRVYAYNDSGKSAYSNVVTVMTMAGPPAGPSELTAVAPDFTQAILTWQDNAGDENGFYVERREPPSANWSRLRELGENAVTFTDTTVRRVKTYQYRVGAFNGMGTTWSNTATVTIPDGPPQAPASVRATPRGVDQVLVTWADRSGNEDGFRILRKMVGEEFFNVIGYVERNITMHYDRGLQPETWYWYQVIAVSNDYGESAPSNIDSTQTWSLMIFTDDFESYAVGPPPPRESGWQVTMNGASQLMVASDIFQSGTKSIYFNDPPGSMSNSIVLVREHRTAVKSHNTMSLYFPAYGDLFAIRGGNQDGNISWEIQFASIGERRAMGIHNGLNWIIIDDIPVNDWIKLEIISDMAQGNYDVKLNDNLVAEDVSFLGGAQTSQKAWAIVCFSNDGTNEINWTHAYMDDASVREIWTPPEDNQSVRPPLRHPGKPISIFDTTVDDSFLQYLNK